MTGYSRLASLLLGSGVLVMEMAALGVLGWGMNDARKPPSWLLAELGFEDGHLNEECTSVTGKPGPHLVTLLGRSGPVQD